MIFKEGSLHQAKDTGMACILICLIGFLFGGQQVWIIAALFFLLLNMIRPQLYSPLAVIWFGLSHKLGGVIAIKAADLITRSSPLLECFNRVLGRF